MLRICCCRWGKVDEQLFIQYLDYGLLQMLSGKPKSATREEVAVGLIYSWWLIQAKTRVYISGTEFCRMDRGNGNQGSNKLEWSQWLGEGAWRSNLIVWWLCRLWEVEFLWGLRLLSWLKATLHLSLAFFISHKFTNKDVYAVFQVISRQAHLLKGGVRPLYRGGYEYDGRVHTLTF